MKNKVISLEYLEYLVEQSILRDKQKEKSREFKPIHHLFQP